MAFSKLIFDKNYINNMALLKRRCHGWHKMDIPILILTELLNNFCNGYPSSKNSNHVCNFLYNRCVLLDVTLRFLHLSYIQQQKCFYSNLIISY